MTDAEKLRVLADWLDKYDSVPLKDEVQSDLRRIAGMIENIAFGTYKDTSIRTDKRYVYFVSYASDRGFGTMDLTVTKPITEINTIRGLKVEYNDRLIPVTPLYYQLLRTE